MARTLLSLWTVDRPALAALSEELRAALADDDRAAVAALMGLGEGLAKKLAERPAVEWFLRADDDAEVQPFYASLRRVAKKRALERVWTSEHPSLEGRLRAYDTVRDDAPLAEAIDRALDPKKLPFFLVKAGATAGIMREEDREKIAEGLGPRGEHRDADLPDELAAFGDAVAEQEGDLVVHDGLD